MTPRDDHREPDEPVNRAGNSGLRDALGEQRPERESGGGPPSNERLMGRPVFFGTVVGIILAHLIGWIPIVGAFLTGLGAGVVARTRYRGLYASYVPAIFTMAWYWLVTYLPDMPWTWADWLSERLAAFEFLLSGASALVFAFVLMGQLLFTVLGGWIGGYWMERREGRPASTHMAS